VADLPELHVLKSLARLPRGDWSRLRDVYGLTTASERVLCTVLAGGQREQQPFLGPRRRAQLVAFLARHSDMQHCARFVARIREVYVASLALRYRIGVEQADTGPITHHLEVQRNEAGDVTTANLYLADRVGENRYAICVELESYLNQDRHRLMSLLSAPREVLAEDGIREEEVEAAAAEIRRQTAAGADQHVDDDTASADAGHGRDDDLPVERATAPEPPADGPQMAPAASTQAAADGSSTGYDTDWPAGSDDRANSPTGVHVRRQPPATPPLDPATAIDLPTLPTMPVFRPLPNTRPYTPRIIDQSDISSQHWTGDALGGGGTSRVDRDDVEAHAVKATLAFFTDQVGAEAISDVQDQNLGWDLEVATQDGTLLIEVKGAAGAAGAFVMTRNELNAARRYTSSYRVSYVTGLANTHPQLTLIRDLSRVDDDQMEALSWSMRGWAHLVEGTWAIESSP